MAQYCGKLSRTGFFEKMLIIFGKNYAIKRLAFIKFAAELTTKNYMYLKIVEYPVSRACFQIFRAKKFFSQRHMTNHFEVIIVTNSEII